MMAFITEVDYIEDTGQRLSQLEFRKDDSRPFSSELEKILMALMRDGAPEKPVDADQPHLDAGRLELAELAAKTLRRRWTKTLVRMVNEYDVFEDVTEGRNIDLNGFASQLQMMMKRLDRSPKLARILKRTEESRKAGRWKRFNLR